MSRAARWQRLQCLPLALESTLSPPPARTSTTTPTIRRRQRISTTRAAPSKNTEWIRGKIWKGEAPGPADPYTQRPDDAAAAADEAARRPSNLPDEALQLGRPRRDKTPAAVRNSRILLPARRSEAPTEREAQAADPTYVPATEADGLEEIAPLSSWWEQPGHWGAESEFRGFAAVAPPSAAAAVEREVLEVHVRRALVEVLALRQAGAFAAWSTRSWRRAGERAALDEALGFDVRVGEDGAATLEGDAAALAQGLMGEQGEAAEEQQQQEMITAEEARDLARQWDPAWKRIVLDEETKFALRKRLYQLTGNLVPDARLAAATTVRHVLTVAGRAPKRAKLAEALESRNAFAGLANVTVHERKIGAIDKEVAVGRWKVVEEELRKRGLPATGYGKMQKNKERDWLTGKV